jgi:hypothetical protein
VGDVICDWCGGTGYDPNVNPENPDYDYDRPDCDECEGTGYVDDDEVNEDDALLEWRDPD